MGSPLVINCTVSTVSGVESSSVMISWEETVGTSGMGPVMTDDSRVTISPTTSSGNNYTSSLQFTYLMEGDEDMYFCNVMILETSESPAVEISLLSECTIHTDAYTHRCIHTQTYRYTDTHTVVHAHTQSHTHAHTHACNSNVLYK